MFREEKRSSPPFACCPLNRYVIAKGNRGRKKKIAENLDFVENSDFIRGSTGAGFRMCSSLNSQENTRGEASFY